MAGTATQQTVPTAPTSTSANSLIGYGTGLLGSAATGAANSGNSAANLYNPLLQQYLTSINNNPLAQLYQTGGTSNPLLEQYLNVAGIPLQQVPSQGGGTLGQGATQNAQGQTLPQPTQSGNRSALVPGPGGQLSTTATGNYVANGVMYSANGQPLGLAPQGTPNGPVGGTQQTGGTAAATGTSSLPQGNPASPNTVSIAANVLSSSNPYGLTQAQQTQLNGQIQQYQQQAQNSVAQYQDQMAQDGVDPSHSAEGAALIQQTYSQMSDQLAATFAQQAQQTQLQALSGLISSGQSADSTSQSQLSSILGSLQQQQDLGYSTSLNAGTAALNQGNVINQQNAQNQANQNNFIGSLLGSIPVIGGSLSSLFGGSGGGGSTDVANALTALNAFNGAAII